LLIRHTDLPLEEFLATVMVKMQDLITAWATYTVWVDRYYNYVQSTYLQPTPTVWLHGEANEYNQPINTVYLTKLRLLQ